MTYFDIMGKYMLKSYRVFSQKYIWPCIVKATLHIKLGKQKLQKNEAPKPGNCRQLTAEEKHALIVDERESDHNFRKYKLEFMVQ